MVALPLVVLSRDGAVIDLLRTNEKGFRKSLEQERLWVLHGETSRLLPYKDGVSFSTLVERSGWYEAVLAEGAAAQAGPDAAPANTAAPTNTAAQAGPDGAPKANTAAPAGPDGAPGAPEDSGAGAAPRPAPGDGSQGRAALPTAEVLARLEDVIIRRRDELPAGSYTTYLFQQGLSKIRKKAGEEAIELVLAATPGETVSEAADFLYHLLVLLVAQRIPLAEVLSELGRRLQ